MFEIQVWSLKHSVWYFCDHGKHEIVHVEVRDRQERLPLPKHQREPEDSLQKA